MRSGHLVLFDPARPGGYRLVVLLGLAGEAVVVEQPGAVRVKVDEGVHDAVGDIPTQLGEDVAVCVPDGQPGALCAYRPSVADGAGDELGSASDADVPCGG